MRIHGTLTKWNDDRGFGFITPAKASTDVFVHISAFPRDGIRPHLNELISFEIEARPDGKPRAVRIMRPGQKRAANRTAVARDRVRSRGSRAGGVFTLLVIAGLGIYGYSRHTEQTSTTLPIGTESATPALLASPPQSSSCDGRTMCPEMTSCAEAKYFIRNCPNTQMDGDGDGVPCEDQWCK